MTDDQKTVDEGKRIAEIDAQMAALAAEKDSLKEATKEKDFEEVKRLIELHGFTQTKLRATFSKVKTKSKRGTAAAKKTTTAAKKTAAKKAVKK